MPKQGPRQGKRAVSERFLQGGLDGIDDVIKIVDRDMRILYVNKAVERLMRTPVRECVGRKCHQVVHGLQKTPAFCLTPQTFETGQPFRSSAWMELKGGSRRFVEYSTYPIKREDGKVTGVVEVIRDATEKKLAEEQLIHNARLVSLGEAAAGIAHEVRSPLNAIKLGLQALDPFLKQDGEAREVASVINRNVERLAEFLSEMLLFARKDSGERAPGDLRRVVQNAVTLVEKQAQDQKVQIVTNFQKGVGPVRFNATHMQQVVHNILLNAIQAMPKGGKVEISVAQGAPQAGLLLRVADTGVGIPDKDKPRVFDPFYSSKPSGIGLGLAISSKIVKDHGGHIAVRDHKPRGTVVEVFLPEE